ncbi:MAG TPA: cytochrome b/b6 domain-containing protein [Rhizomicrobium sp.]|nr:cytochrome b/b6 domain-containing protein [Rhizomicrobium sp.]
MSTASQSQTTASAPWRWFRRRPPGEIFYRHAALVRLAHWINALCILFLLGSGLNIFNAHPRLYWGQYGANADPAFISIDAYDTAAGTRGITQIGHWHFDTTGVLGWSKYMGEYLDRAWPAWLTIPSYQDLADARHWHFLFAWILVLNGLLYLIWGFANRHVQKDLWPTRADLKSIPRSILDHLLLRHPAGEAAKRYNVLQRIAYLGVILLIALMVLTGLTMSPGIDAFCPWLLDIFGGRQSARTIHFLSASLIVLFVFVHLVEVVLAGPINEIRSMLTGNYVVPKGHGK